MPTFPSKFSSQARKYIKKLDAVTKRRISKKIDELEGNPFPQGVERVEKYKGEKSFRVRLGKQRILYTRKNFLKEIFLCHKKFLKNFLMIVRYNPNKLIIARIDKRPRVYD